MITLVIGGARSGKSRYAGECAARAEADGAAVVVIATALAGDEEMAERIARHRADRPPAWRTVEAPVRLGEALRREAGPGRFVVVDCLTLWLTNLIAPLPGAPGGDLDDECRALLEAIEALDAAGADLVLVGNEVGQGVTPRDALSRRFVDEAGWLHQAVAGRAQRVVWMVAGLPVAAKGAL